MKIVELKNDKQNYHVEVSVSDKDIVNTIDAKLADIRKTAKMDGFRPGKAPLSFLKKKYAPSIRADIVKEKVDKAIDDSVKKNNLNIALDPSIEDVTNEEGKDFKFTLKFALLPEIELPDFKKISIEKPELKVSTKEVDEQLERLASFSKTYDKESKVKAKEGDQLTIDAVGYVDGKAFDGGKLTDHKLVLGSKAFIPGFEDQLIGSKKGDDITVKVDFPKEYHAKNIAGKPSEFKVQIKAVHKEDKPKIDDEFAKKFKCESLEELKKQAEQNIQASYDEPIRVMMKMHLFDKLEGMLKFDLPDTLLKRESEILQKQLEQKEGGDEEFQKMSSKEKEKHVTKLSTRRVRIGLMLAEYVKQEKVQLKDEDIRQAIFAQARNYPGQEKEIIEFYQKDRRALESLKGPVLEEKSVQEIFDKEIKLVTKSYPKDKLEKLLDKEIRD